MERITNRSFEDFPPATLYLNDIESIVDVFVKTCKRVEITAGEYKIVDANELKAMAEKFPEGRFVDVKIQGHHPYLSIEFLSYAIRAYVSEDSAEQIGTVARMREIILRRKKRSPSLAITILTGIAIVVAVWQFLSKEYATGIVLGALSLMSISIAVRTAMRNNVIVHSKNQGEFKSFFQRKKDDILLAAIAALLGGAVSYAVTKYIQ